MGSSKSSAAYIFVNSAELLAHVVYLNSDEPPLTDISSPIDNSQYKKGRTIPVNFIVQDANNNIVQTTWSAPEITLFQVGFTPIEANCGTSTPFAIFIDGTSPHYQCTLKTNLLEPGHNVTISIHLDDGLDPADFSDDREVTIFIK